MIKHTIRLFSNTPDNLHCVQACLQMIFLHFDMPVPTMRELDIFTGHVDGAYTQDTNVIMFLMNYGFLVTHIEPLDYVQFAERGPAYLREIFGPERYEDQCRHSDLVADQRSAKELMHFAPRLINRKPLVRDVIGALVDGYIPMISIGNHVVVVTGYLEDQIFVNDPGIPAAIYSVSRVELARMLYSAMLIKKRT